MITNEDRITTLDRYRKNQGRDFEPSWADNAGSTSVAKLVLSAGFLILVGVLAYGLAQRAQSVRDDAYTESIKAECRAEDKVPHIERDRAGKAIAVRCEVARP